MEEVEIILIFLCSPVTFSKPSLNMVKLGFGQADFVVFEQNYPVFRISPNILTKVSYSNEFKENYFRVREILILVLNSIMKKGLLKV